MSRSRKRVWGFTDHRSPHSRIAKRFANKKVRHTAEIQNGGAYRKVFSSWDICDYKFLYFRRSDLDGAADGLYRGRIYKYYTK